MNKPLLIVLVLVLIGLAAYTLLGTRSEVVPEVPETTVKPNSFEAEPENGIETDELPEFQVQVTPKKVGGQNKLEFAMTEAHGWWVNHIYVEAWYRELNEETGEWERKMERPVQYLCKDVLRFNETLVEETTLTDPELDDIGGDPGTTENWEGRIYKWHKIFKKAAP